MPACPWRASRGLPACAAISAAPSARAISCTGTHGACGLRGGAGLGGHKATGSAACKAREKSPCLAHHGIRSVLSECSVGFENSRRVQLKVEAQLPSLSHAHTAQAGLLPTCSISNGYSDASLATSAAAPSSRRRHQLVLFISSLFSAPALRRSIATATELPRIAVH